VTKEEGDQIRLAYGKVLTYADKAMKTPPGVHRRIALNEYSKAKNEFRALLRSLEGK
jgi:hypothetical protein